MGIVKLFVNVLVRWLWPVGTIIIIMIWGAVEAPAKAETVQEVLCRHICPPLDRGLKKIDAQIRLTWAKWKGRSRSVSPRPAVGRGPSCGRLPDRELTVRCCLDVRTRLVIEFVGNNPYAYPETPWRAVCTKD